MNIFITFLQIENFIVPVILSLWMIQYNLALNINDEFQYLEPEREYNCCQNESYVSNRNLPVVYCFKGLPKSIVRTWMSVSIKTHLNSEDYDLYEGSNSDEVKEKFNAEQSSWISGWTFWKNKLTKLNPFNSTCFGIRTNKDYTLILNITDLDFYFLTIFTMGIIVFFYSSSLSENAIFYYVAAILIGMSASVLILIYFIFKLLPLKKSVVFGTVAGGAAITSYFMQFVYNNLASVMIGYQNYVVGYFASTAFISFIAYYRFGPVSDARSKTLMKYALQIIASLFLYTSSYFTEAIYVTIAVMFVCTNVPCLQWAYYCTKLGSWMRFKADLQKPRKLLSMEEYKKEGIKETERALAELREYCFTPEFYKRYQHNFWLKTPKKFGEFLVGSNHVSKEEYKTYKKEINGFVDDTYLTDDDSD